MYTSYVHGLWEKTPFYLFWKPKYRRFYLTMVYPYSGEYDIYEWEYSNSKEDDDGTL